MQQSKFQKRAAGLATMVLGAMVLMSAPALAAATCVAGTTTGTATATISGSETVVMAAGVVQVGSASCPPDVEVITLDGSAGADNLTFDLAGGDFEAGGDGISFRIDLGGGTDALTVEGSSGDDRVSMGTDGLNLNGSGDVEVRAKTPGGTPTFATDSKIENFVMNGNDGNDSLRADGSASGDPLAAYADLDIDGGADSDILKGGNNTLTAVDTILGGDGDDDLEGGMGTDTLTGGDGNDTFDQTDVPDGPDTMDGGIGTDTLDYSDRAEALSITLNATADDGAVDADTVTAGNQSEADNASNFERFFGGSGDDTITGSAAVGAPKYQMYGNDGADTMTGGDGKDYLDGDKGDDVMNGGAGKDTFSGGADDDVMNGDAGNDTFDMGDAKDGNDDIDGGADTDKVKYGLRNKTVTLTLDSGADNDGEAGETDTIVNVEKAYGGRADDTISGATNSTNYKLFGGSGNDTLTGAGGNDKLVGSDGDDTLTGGAGNDRLLGGDGNDTLSGGDGDDRLNGGSGTDSCIGGAGTNTKASCE